MRLNPFDQGFFFFIAIIKLCYAFLFIYILYPNPVKQNKTKQKNRFTTTQTTDMHHGYIWPGSCIILALSGECISLMNLSLFFGLYTKVSKHVECRHDFFLLLLTPRKLRWTPVQLYTGQITRECCAQFWWCKGS